LPLGDSRPAPTRRLSKATNWGDAIQKRIDAFCQAEAFELAESFVEEESGKGADALDRRPRLAAALATAKRRRCPILVAKLDRLSRDVAFISGLMSQRSASLSPSWASMPISRPSRWRCAGTAIVARNPLCYRNCNPFLESLTCQI
jgi:hypothetical protein